jgi:hypothetical protein
MGEREGEKKKLKCIKFTSKHFCADKANVYYSPSFENLGI